MFVGLVISKEGMARILKVQDSFIQFIYNVSFFDIASSF